MFDKYRKFGAYHWNDIDSSSMYKLLNRSLPLYTRYQVCLDQIQVNACNCIEIGCGDAALTYLIAQKRIRVLGCDTDETGIELAKQKIKKLPLGHFISLYCGRFQNCHIKSNSVDVVVLADVVEHLEHPELFFQEIKRIGKKGGRLIITTPVAKKNGLWDNAHVQEYTVESLSSLLKEYFPSTLVAPFLPEIVYKIYHSFFLFRYLFNGLAFLGVNLFKANLPIGRHIMLLGVSEF